MELIMEKKAKDSVMAAFVADALSLGVHWVYRTSDIEDRYGRLEKMVTPEIAPFHKGKEKGEFTHYGDQMLVFLESLVALGGFDSQHFLKKWQDFFKSYAGYQDHATKDTLETLQQDPSQKELGSQSTDLAGASRIAPLALFYADNPDTMVDAARQQTALTHNHPHVVNTAEWLARVFLRVKEGETPSMAVFSALNDMQDAFGLNMMIDAGYQSREEDTRKTIARLGAMCSVEGALPSVVHLIVKYENDLKQALVENIMAGGDSAARGIAAGFVIAAHTGIDAIPTEWLTDLKAFDAINTAINSV